MSAKFVLILSVSYVSEKVRVEQLMTWKLFWHVYRHRHMEAQPYVEIVILLVTYRKSHFLTLSRLRGTQLGTLSDFVRLLSMTIINFSIDW